MWKELFYIIIFFCFIYFIIFAFIKYITDKVLERRFKKLKEDDKRRNFKTRKQATESGIINGGNTEFNQRIEQSRILPLPGSSNEEPDNRGIEINKTDIRESIFKKLGL